MAIMDALARFIYDTDIDTLTANTRLAIGDVYDIQADTYGVFGGSGVNGDYGDNASPIYVNFIVNDTFDMSSTATLKFDISYDNAVTSNNLTSANELTSRTFTNDVAKGTQFSLFIPVGVTVERYLQAGLTASEGRTDAQTGSLTIWLDTKPVETRTLYPEGRNWV